MRASKKQIDQFLKACQGTTPNLAAAISPSEADFTETVLDLARLFRWRTAHFRTVRVARKDGSVHYETPVQGDGKGFFDLELVRGPRLLKVELKTDVGTLTREQKVWFAAYEAVPAIEVYIWRPSQIVEIVEILK